VTTRPDARGADPLYFYLFIIGFGVLCVIALFLCDTCRSNK
jgi:hypothetical protein